MNDERSFLDAIVANPSDEDLRLVYADWLEERGDPRGEFLRIEVQLASLPAKDPKAKALRARLAQLQCDFDEGWLAQVDRTRVEGCFHDMVRSEYQCPMRWEQLKPTDDPLTRFCDECRQRVFHCATVEQAQRHADRGHCVAVDSRLVRKPGDLRADPTRDPNRLFLGRVAPRLPRYRPGQVVTIYAGLYAGLTGRVESLCLSRLRATVVVVQSDRQTPVEVDFEDLERRPSAVTYPRRFRTGQRVILLTTPFTGMEGEIERIDPEFDRAVVAITVFGRRVPVEVDFVNLEEVES